MTLCVLFAIHGVTRLKDLKSASLPSFIQVGPSATALCDPEIAATGHAITDDYDGDSHGLFEGQEPERDRRFIDDCLTLGEPVYIFCTKVEPRSKSVQDPTIGVKVPPAPPQHLDAGTIDWTRALPKDTLLAVRRTKR